MEEKRRKQMPKGVRAWKGVSQMNKERGKNRRNGRVKLKGESQKVKNHSERKVGHEKEEERNGEND